MNGGVQNTELRNKILRAEAPRIGTTVSYNAKKLAQGGGTGVTVFDSALDKGVVQKEILGNGSSSWYYTDGDKGLLKKMFKKGRTSGVALTKKSGVDTLVHELGHAEGTIVGGRRGKISAADPRTKAAILDRSSTTVRAQLQSPLRIR